MGDETGSDDLADQRRQVGRDQVHLRLEGDQKACCSVGWGTCPGGMLMLIWPWSGFRSTTTSRLAVFPQWRKKGAEE